MPENRPAIPADLRRRVLLEAGYRCAIPTCRAWPVEIEHIEEWAKAKEHRFENLIALCPTCHARKGDKPGQIDRKALRSYKANLAVINSLYNDVERRVLEIYAAARQAGEQLGRIPLPGAMHFMLIRLIGDGYLECVGTGGVFNNDVPLTAYYALTDAGVELIDQWIGAQPIEPLEPDSGS